MTTTATQTRTIEELIPIYGDAWASHDPDRIAALHAADGIFQLHSGDSSPVEGRAAIRDAFAGFIALFPDIDFAEEEMLVAEAGWSVRWKMSGTLALPYPLEDGQIEPGGRMSIDAIDLIAVSDGLIAAKHTYLDWAAALEQLGRS